VAALEPNALDDIGGYLCLVAAFSRNNRGQQRKERGAHADKGIGAQTGGLAANFALKADGPAQQAGRKQTP
jgi:hypothetical protein